MRDRDPSTKTEHSDSHSNIIVASIGAAGGILATLIAGLIGHATGVTNNIFFPGSATPKPNVTITVTKSAGFPASPAASLASSSASPSGIGSIACPSGQDCKIWNLAVPMGDFTTNSETGIHFETGQVVLNDNGEMGFGSNSAGIPELDQEIASSFSVNVTAQNASKAQCQTATTSSPDADPITDFHVGLLFCVLPDRNNGGIALVEETKPLGSSKILYLREIYWPS